MNCGSTEHLTQACTKPELPRERRPCWKCGKPGHIGRDCRSTAAAAKLVDENQSEEVRHYFGVVDFVDEEGYTTVGKKGRPVPSQTTFGDYLQTAKREAMATNSSFKVGLCGGSAQSGYKCCGERPFNSKASLESASFGNLPELPRLAPHRLDLHEFPPPSTSWSTSTSSSIITEDAKYVDNQESEEIQKIISDAMDLEEQDAAARLRVGPASDRPDAARAGMSEREHPIQGISPLPACSPEPRAKTAPSCTPLTVDSILESGEPSESPLTSRVTKLQASTGENRVPLPSTPPSENSTRAQRSRVSRPTNVPEQKSKHDLQQAQELMNEKDTNGVAK